MSTINLSSKSDWNQYSHAAYELKLVRDVNLKKDCDRYIWSLPNMHGPSLSWRAWHQPDLKSSWQEKYVSWDGANVQSTKCGSGLELPIKIQDGPKFYLFFLQASYSKSDCCHRRASLKLICICVSDHSKSANRICVSHWNVRMRQSPSKHFTTIELTIELVRPQLSSSSSSSATHKYVVAGGHSTTIRIRLNISIRLSSCHVSEPARPVPAI